MAYSDFTLKTVLKAFELQHIESQDLFSATKPVPASDFLQQLLMENVPLALSIGSEKARSELIIVNVLVEVRKKLNHQISLFSGIKFDVDIERNLTGYCDFLIGCSPEQLFINAPVIAVVEAKNENIIGGLGQCIAEMVAAKEFNLQEGREITTLYGIVTSGSEWKFLKLVENQVFIDVEQYYLRILTRFWALLFQ